MYKIILAVLCLMLPPLASNAATVLEVQQMLSDLGYQPGVVDGKWGSQTRDAIKRFQADESLPVTGKRDQITVQALETRFKARQSLLHPVEKPPSQQDPIAPTVNNSPELKSQKINNSALAIDPTASVLPTNSASATTTASEIPKNLVTTTAAIPSPPQSELPVDSEPSQPATSSAAISTEKTSVASMDVDPVASEPASSATEVTTAQKPAAAVSPPVAPETTHADTSTVATTDGIITNEAQTQLATTDATADATTDTTTTVPVTLASILEQPALKSPAGIMFVHIPGGCFSMGAAGVDNAPAHEVCVHKGGSFYIGQYEVTQGQWEAVTGQNPAVYVRSQDYPIENVSWNSIQKFIAKLNDMHQGKYRLPTEAEWEYSARGGTTTQYWWGDMSPVCEPDKPSGANFKGEAKCPNTTVPVGTYQPNPFGLYDILGNVWEWVEDLYLPDAYEKSSPQDPIIIKGNGTNRVFRGGSWLYPAEALTVFYRDHGLPEFQFSHLGFRLIYEP